jgi:serine/threonine protein kinase/Tol biopolymer transport system component
MIGQTISHYRIIEKLGSGGMGVVYKAQDVRLGRFVALKFLPADYADDPQLRERFQREARAACTLNHPNICTIYDIGEDDGHVFMAMEFLDGMTLKELTKRGPVELKNLIDIALQVIDGLDVAHRKGIIHRDIKPANLLVTVEGRTKILDFGLAKVTTPWHANAIASSEAETLSNMTIAGGILGTMPYMSPEQALGEPLDARTDLFSFGVTLYEMATGEMPFHGETPSALCISIVRDSPVPATHINPSIPTELQRIINKCLEKDVELRYQHSCDVRADLLKLQEASNSRQIAGSPNEGAQAKSREFGEQQDFATKGPRFSGRKPSALQEEPSAAPGKKWIWIAAVVTIAVLAFVFWWNRAYAVPTVEAVTQLTDDGEPKPNWSNLEADGSRVYFNEGTNGDLKIAEVSTNGGATAAVSTPSSNQRILALSLDGSALLALSGRYETFLSGLYPLWELPLPTGEPRQFAGLQAQDGSFAPDGRVLLAKAGGLYLAQRDGSNPREVISGLGSFIGEPSFSPDGQQIVFTLYSQSGRPVSIYEVRADGSGLHAIVNDSATGNVCCGRWAPDGKYIVFSKIYQGQRDIWVLVMKPGILQRRQKPVQLTNGPLSYAGPVVSRDGKKIFAVGSKERSELVRYDANSRQFVPFLSGISAFSPTFSSDGKWVAYASYPDHMLWRSRSDGTDRLQLTFPPMKALFPFISPDGKRVVFWNADGETYIVSMDGGRPRMVITKDSAYANWSPDGKFLVYTDSRTASPQLWVLDLRTAARSVVPESLGMVGGQWITQDTLVASRAGSTTMRAFDFKTKKWSDLAPGAIPKTIVNWLHSPDYKYLYLAAGGAEPEVLRFRVADGKVETIASLKDLRQAPGPNGNTQIGVAPDGSPVFSRDIGMQEVYALTLKWP